MLRPIGALGLAAAVSLLLVAWPGQADAEQASYESTCVPAKSQQSALACPSGAKAISGAAGKIPQSRMTTGGRQEEPTKRPAAKGPGVSDSVVQQARSGFRQKRESKARDLL